MHLVMRMLLAGLLLVVAGTAGATAQVPDRIFIEGRDYALDTIRWKASCVIAPVSRRRMSRAAPPTCAVTWRTGR